jgi:dimethylamine monooxygenase subunit A
MGLRPLDPARWLEPDRHRPAELRRKDELLRTRPGEVVAHLPEAWAASVETRDMVLAELVPELCERDGDRVTDRATGLTVDLAALHPVDAAGRLVQEDLCVMVRRDAGWVLGAASLCFPNRWVLAEKMGVALTAIHDPVPGYAERLATATDRLFDGMRADRPVWRANWSILDRPELFLPDPDTAREHVPAPAADAVGRLLHVRVERQTLRLLPASGGVLFTIRTYVGALEDVVGTSPALAADLAVTVRAVYPESARYRGWTTLRAPMLAWLDAYPHRPPR